MNFIDPWGLSASDGRGNNGNANLLLSGLTKTLSGSVKTVAGLAGAAAGMFASAALVKVEQIPLRNQKQIVIIIL